jgi:hypothetical protein
MAPAGVVARPRRRYRLWGSGVVAPRERGVAGDSNLWWREVRGSPGGASGGGGTRRWVALRRAVEVGTYTGGNGGSQPLHSAVREEWNRERRGARRRPARGGNRGGARAHCGQENREEGGGDLIAEGAGEGLEEKARAVRAARGGAGELGG